MWNLELCSRSGVTLATFIPSSISIEIGLNQVCKGTFVLDDDDQIQGLTDLEVGATLLRGWRKGTLRFAGIVTELDDSADIDSDEALTITAHDPLFVLSRRFAEAEIDWGTSVNAATLVSNAITLANTQEESHLEMGLAPSVGNRDGLLEAGKQLDQYISDLAEAEGGFWYRTRPVASGATVGYLDVLYPDSGDDLNETVRFEYGSGTVGNLETMKVVSTLPTTRVVANIPGDSELAPLDAVVQDVGSVATFGMWAAYNSYSDIADINTVPDLEEYAAKDLNLEPVRTFDCSMALHAPKLWDDFDIGDIIGIFSRGRSPRLSFSTETRVVSCTYTCNDESVEQITQIVLEETNA